MKSRLARSSAAGLVKEVGLEAVAQRPASRLSGGQLRRVGLACALVHDPQLAIFDEPTAGLDPRQRRNFRSLITSLRPSTDLLVSTHIVDDVAQTYDNVVVLEQGRFIWSGEISQFLALTPDRSAESALLSLVACASQRPGKELGFERAEFSRFPGRASVQ